MKIPTFRDIKNQARLNVHETLQVAGLYLESPADQNPKEITIRVWTKWQEFGKIKPEFSDFSDANPKIIFLRSQIPLPKKNAIVSVERGEAYRIESTEASDGLTVTAIVAKIPESTPYLLDIPVPSNV